MGGSCLFIRVYRRSYARGIESFQYGHLRFAPVVVLILPALGEEQAEAPACGRRKTSHCEDVSHCAAQPPTDDESEPPPQARVAPDLRFASRRDHLALFHHDDACKRETARRLPHGTDL